MQDEKSFQRKGDKKGPVFPVKHYWVGFDQNGKEKWFIELNNGRVVSYLDENYQYWLRKYKIKMKRK